MVGNRPSFIVRHRVKGIRARSNPVRRRGYLKYTQWETVKACNTLDEALSLADELQQKFIPSPSNYDYDVLVSHHGRRVNDKVKFGQAKL